MVKSIVPRMPGIDSRQAALRILEQVRAGKTFEVALDGSIAKLAEPDRRLAHELAAGVLRQRSVLDSRLAPLVPRGWSSVTPELQDILRLGAYQLTSLDRVPDHAAVDTCVALAKKTAGARAGAFVNAVLRQVTRTAPASAPPAGADAEKLAVGHSHPVWLVRRWMESFGPAATETLLRWNNSRPRLVLQPARRGSEALASRWRAAGIEVEPAPYGAGLITNLTRPADLPGFPDGDFIVQDPAQALLATFADVSPEALVYDVCAAPGGKTIALGRQSKSVIAGEVSRSRARRLLDNVRRAGSGREQVVVADGRHPPLRQADLVLVDAPCLGTGTFARHPDARWRVTPEGLASLERLQAELLEQSAAVVPVGGLLVYSTCSLEPEENRAQVDRFLGRHSEFRREQVGAVPNDLLSPEGDLTILPHKHGMDGAFAARLRRTR
ncbi:MAG TPA: 16S rRNA (cytosine(967)-C(5))-methyltransferase RsmB [Gemmatimonadales bacterium]|nr:16S rRNA (cytosine(967)-C(5))-methyltransferase RsmB [Gemmatimonadales bacterium]